MVTVEVLDAVAVKDDDGHHHEAVVVEAELVSDTSANDEEGMLRWTAHSFL